MAASKFAQLALKSHGNVKDRLSLLNNPSTVLPTIWVVAIALVNECGEVLVQQRPAAGAHAGLWEFPGGKLEAGESPEQAAVRELHEELGIAIPLDALRPVTFASGIITHEIASQSIVILLFVCDRWEGVPVPLAATGLAWTDPARLATWAMPPLDYPLAQALAKMLGEDAN